MINQIKFALTLILTFFLIGIVSADGCCFVPSTGICSMGAESASCLGNSGEFYSSPSCSETACDLGCCIMGANTEYATARTCELNSRIFGFDYNWQIMDESSCMALRQGGQEGACLLGGDYEKNCKITTLDKCSSGDFYAGLTCTDPDLNTICEETSKTYCYQENVWSQDSCGNPDKKIEECNYGAGFICAKKTVTEAYCKSLNCEDKTNGDSWCVDLFGKGNRLAPPIGSESDVWGLRPPVGSREFVQSCVNGKIEVEPCADFRNELCDGGECSENDWAGCSGANEASEDNSEEVTTESECGSAGDCEMFDPMAWITNPDDEEMIADLHLELCVPQTKGGQEFWETSADESVCAAGNYETTIRFHREQRPDDEDELDKYWLMITSGMDYGNVGLLNQTQEEWDSGETFASYGGYKLIRDGRATSSRSDGSPASYAAFEFENTWADKIFEGTAENIPINGDVITALKKRCKKLGDCAAEVNWLGNDVGDISVYGDGFITIDPEEGIYELPCEVISATKAECDFEFECIPWAAPGSGKCELCGQDGLPCSEYRCAAIGENCEFVEEREACVKSNDRAPPGITLVSRTPGDPIPPYTPAEFVIATSEKSECKFNFDTPGNKYSEMKYNFGKEFGIEHKLIINLPGQSKVDESDIDQTAYNLMKQGNHTIYVRCLDARGNGETMAPFQIKFEVMQDPDKIPPVIQNFTPVSGSAIVFNTTSKKITLKINEPSECRWSQNDVVYDLMNNSFNCDTEISDKSILEGYYCSGTLTDITTNLSQQTRVYIRCKDQPWLEGNEDANYQRNTNTQSTSYILRASQEFKIIDISPSGTVFLSNNQNISTELKAYTSGGGLNGRANCKWRLSNTTDFSGIGYTNFLTTGTTLHKQNLTGLSEGTKYVHIRCEDSSENLADSYSTFTLIIDRNAPIIAKIYEKFGNLFIKTNEDSVCYISDNKETKCSFKNENATRMSGSEEEHESEWEFDKTYFIRCKDYYGNENPTNCNMITRTY